jgi:hypothetical protein
MILIIGIAIVESSDGNFDSRYQQSSMTALIRRQSRLLQSPYIDEAYLLNLHSMINAQLSLFLPKDHSCNNCPFFTYDWTKILKEAPILVLLVGMSLYLHYPSPSSLICPLR